MLTQERLKQLLHYNEGSGEFFWALSRRGVKAGKKAGTKHHTGYIAIKIDYEFYLAHRLAWMWSHGEFPKSHIDHINRNKFDNRLANLREVTNKQNHENSGIQKNNATGYRGVSWIESTGKYKAYLHHNKKQIYFGCFKTPEKAFAAAQAGRDKFFTHHTI
jgi:hypothetical protein